MDDLDDLVGRARRLIREERRALLGLCGPPGAGKSRLAAQLVERLGPEGVVVPLDGFHLHDDVLADLELLDRKGAPSTFDVAGYLSLLTRIRDGPDPVYAPAFDRQRELALAAAIPVIPAHRLVVTEGNYLLLDTPGWRDIRPLLDTCWYLELDDDLRRTRLVDRHVSHGRTRAEAIAWVERSDEANARSVAATRPAADRIIELP